MIDPMLKDATFSPCGRYRYCIVRHWTSEPDCVAFIMLNPSTADESADDPTLRRCIAFARKWGYSGVRVVNLFALRSSDPSVLRGAGNPVEHRAGANAFWVDCIATRADRVVAAWGAFPLAAGLGGRTADRLRGLGVELVCLGKTASGSPRHPLYVRGDTKVQPWP